METAFPQLAIANSLSDFGQVLSPLLVLATLIKSTDTARLSSRLVGEGDSG